MNAKNACAVFLSVAFLVLFMVIVLPSGGPWPVIPPAAAGAGSALWKGRTYEAVLQGVLVLAGVLSILLLLGINQSRRLPP